MKTESKCRKCPSCGYVISEVEYFQARYDYPCQGCKRRRLSEFKMCGEKR